MSGPIAAMDGAMVFAARRVPAVWGNDRADSCPAAGELINGNQDLDRCLDEGKRIVELRDDRIELLAKLRFTSRKSTKIDPSSFLLLDQVVTLRGREQGLAVRVEGHHDSTHTDQHGSRLSHAQAKSVARYLITKGVAARRVESVGYGEAKPIASNRTKAGRDQTGASKSGSGRVRIAEPIERDRSRTGRGHRQRNNRPEARSISPETVNTP